MTDDNSGKAARRRRRDPTPVVLVAGFFAGLAHLFLTPPFEGFDETAHYSSVQLIADAGRIPVYGRDVFAQDVVDYLADAPSPYGSTPPFDENAGLTYADAFASADREASVRAMISGRVREARRYSPAGPLNWQAQHPPLAYLLLAPVYHATKGLDWKTHLFFLRLLCFLTAIAGLAIAVFATRAHFRASAKLNAADRADYFLYAPAIMAAWPFYAPMFFPEMARLGNDAFCLLFAGLAWAALLRFLRAPTGDGAARLQWAVLLGLSLGMGALTKAFFPPVAAGIGAFLLIREGLALRESGGRSARLILRAFLPVASMAFVFIAVAVWWYAATFAATGALASANDIVALRERGDFGALLGEHFSLALFVKRLISVYMSFLWAGTWSLVAMPNSAIAGLGIFFALVIGRYLAALATTDRREAAFWSPVFIVVPVAAGLAFHVLTQIAMGETGVGTPGWYLHIFAGPIGFSFAAGAVLLWRRAAGRWALAAGFTYTLIFAAVAEFHQLALFTGCAVRGGESRYYQPTACFGDISEMWRRLDVVANPAMGATAFIVAAAAGAYAIRILARERRGAAMQKTP